MPSPDEETLNHILKAPYPTLKRICGRAVLSVCLDLQIKARNSEISAKALDLRGASGGDRADEDPDFLRPGNPYGRGQQSFDLFEGRW